MRDPGVDASQCRLLIVEDDASDTAFLRSQLARGPLAEVAVDEASSLDAALGLLAGGRYDAVLLDLGLPDSDGVATFDAVLGAAVDAAVIVVTDLDDEALAEEAIRRGAQDYLIKGDRRCGDLTRAVLFALRRQTLLTELRTARDAQLRQKRQFLAHISEELRYPVGLVHQYAALLADGIAGPLNEEQVDLLFVLIRNAAQLGVMIDDLVQASQADGAVSIEVSAVSPATLLAGALVAFQPVAQEKGVRLAYEHHAVPPVHADAHRIREVLANLLENAVKFTPPGGSVTLSAEADGDVVRFTVRDTGCGIAPAALPHVFEQFFQADLRDGVQRTGLGLGLYVCRDLVTRQGGEITAASEVGAGTTVCFTLPRESRAARAEVPA